MAIIVIFTDNVWQPMAQRLADELASPSVYIVQEKWWHHNATVWGEAEYFARVRQRIPYMRSLLVELPLDNCWVALFDADIVVSRNITARFTNWFQRTDTQLIVQQEVPCRLYPRMCVNGGLWAVRRSPRGLALLTRAEQLMRRLHIPDQDALDIVASREAVYYLDEDLYANGFTIQTRHRFKAHRAHAMHVNRMKSTACKFMWLEHLRRTRFYSTDAYETATELLRARRCGV